MNYVIVGFLIISFLGNLKKKLNYFLVWVVFSYKISEELCEILNIRRFKVKAIFTEEIL